MSAFTTVENVEIINIYNDTAPFDTDGTNVEANKFVGSTLINQVGLAANVKNLANTQTAKFTDITANVSVTALDAATKANIELSNFDESKSVTVLSTATGALNEVNIAGTVKDTNANGTVASIAVNVTVGKDVKTLTLNSAVASTLAITETTATNVTTVDASTSKGNITFAGTTTNSAASTAYKVTTIKTGSGNDVVTLIADTVADNTATTADETVNASVSTGAGNDTITVNTGSASLATKAGATTVDAGAGDDIVTITTRSDGKLTVNLGDGNDTFTSAVAIVNGDVVDAGAGIDTLLLKLVGVANVSSFKNFDVYDVKGMNTNLDLAILDTNNTVTEIVASGDLAGSMTLTNLAHNVGYRVTADTTAATRVLTLTQKAAGALTITNDIDETSLIAAATTGANDAEMAVTATNATSVNAVFDADFFGKSTGAGDNTAAITLTTAAATSLTVVSGGDNATNALTVTDNAATAGKLASISITGDKALSVTFSATNGSVLETVDASNMTGGLTMSMVNLKNGGELILGSGVDVITVTSASNAVTNSWESIKNFEKALAVSVSTVPADAAAKADAIADADNLVLASGAVANSTLVTGATGATLSNGVLAWTGQGPATLTAAIAIADLYAETQHEVVLFEYLGNSYVFKQGVTHDNNAGGSGTPAGVTSADTLVKLVGVTGVTNLVEDGTTDNFFIV